MDEPKTESIQTGSTGAGALIRTARESQGLHIAMLAASLKIPVKKLEALEADQYDLLPDTVFLRALASSVCRALKMDVAPVLAALPRNELPRIKTDESGLNTVFNDAASKSANSLFTQITRPFGIAMIVIAIGIIIAVLGQPKSFTPKVGTVNTDQTESTTPIFPSQASAIERKQLKDPDVLMDAVTPDAAASMPLIGQMQNVLAGSDAPAKTVSMPVEVAANNPNVLHLQGHGSSWVEVIDAQGVVLLRKTLNTNEKISVSGKLPLSVVLGRSDLVVVTVRGQLFDTAQVAKNNVARFEVK